MMNSRHDDSTFMKSLAAWKIIKGWLPPKFVDRVKFQDKKNLKDYIDPENQLAEWGGSDNYVFKFVPEVRKPRGNQQQQQAPIPNGNVGSLPPEVRPKKVRLYFIISEN
jgi:hypothetical protein